MRKLYTLFVASAVALSARSQSQDSLKTTLLDEVVTTASRSDQVVLGIPRSVSVINRETLEKSVFNSVGELLANQSGIYVVGANQTPGSTQSLFLRGANSNQVAIMIDGARVTDPSSPNASIDVNELSLTDVERIEIIRGSHSSLYGGSAVGGVINIITKKNQGKGFHGNADLQAGTFGKSSFLLSETLGLNYNFSNGVYMNGSMFNQNVRGLNASIDTLAHSSQFSTRDKDDFEKTDAYIKGGFKNTNWDAFVSFKKIDQQADIDNGVYNDDDNAILKFKRNLVNYQVAYQIAKQWRLTVIGSWSNSLRHSLNDSSVNDEAGNYDATFIEGKYTGEVITNEVQANYVSEKVNGVFGVGQFREEMSFNTYYFNRSAFGVYESTTNYDTLDTSAKTNYLFGQIGVTLDNFNFSVGTRLSHHSLFGTKWTVEANPSYYIGTALLYVSLSTGFNPASLYQLYDPTQGFNAFTTRGNKNLKPEESTSLEIGVKKEFNGGNYITLSAYRTETKNSIEYIYLWDKNTSVDELTFMDNLGDTYINIARQKVQGIEIDGNIVFSRFNIHANASWLDGQITISPADINNQQTGGNHVQLFNYGSFVTEDVTINKLVRRPKFTTFATLTYRPSKNIKIAGTYRCAGSRFDSGYDANLGPYGALNQFKVKSYNLVDLSAHWEVNKVITLGIKIENILNEEYQEIIGFNTRGRSGYLKAMFRW
jgi:vitamin B12 transporter